MVDTETRDKIKAEIYALAQEHFSKAESYPVVEENPAIGRRVHIQWVGDSPVMVNYLSVDGLFVKDYEGFTSDYVNNI